MVSLERLRKAARGMYLITDEAVADDISGLLTSAADSIVHLEEETTSLKCCGNCKHYFTVDCPLREEIDCYPDSTPIYSDTEPDEVCANWTFDRRTAKDRMTSKEDQNARRSS
jgi:hypothetical protein